MTVQLFGDFVLGVIVGMLVIDIVRFVWRRFP